MNIILFMFFFGEGNNHPPIPADIEMITETSNLYMISETGLFMIMG